MTTETTTAAAPWYGNTENLAAIFQGAGEGAKTALQGNAASMASRKEAREAKRRTLANLMNSAMKRRQRLLQAQEEYSGDINDMKAQALQKVALGFVNALQGSTGY